MDRPFFASRWRHCSALYRRVDCSHHGLGLWKTLASALLYIDVSVRPSSEALFFFGHLLTRFNLPLAQLVRQALPPAVSSSIDLSDAMKALLEFDD